MRKVSPRNFGGEGARVKLTRRSRKPRTSFYQEPANAPEFRLLTQDWREIEVGYGQLISERLRNEIISIVDDYLWFVECEKIKGHAIEAMVYLKKLANAKSPLAILIRTPKKPAHRMARDVLLEYYLFEEASPMDKINPEKFLSTPDRVALAAKELVDDISAQDMVQSKAKPVEWDKMVVRLMITLRRNGLPYTVNKRGTLKGASSIVSLLHEIQDRLPTEYRLHVGRDREPTDETMAAAASAAWVGYKNSSEGKYALREQRKVEKAKNEGREYKIKSREERLNEVFKYLENRRRRRLSKLSND